MLFLNPEMHDCLIENNLFNVIKEQHSMAYNLSDVYCMVLLLPSSFLYNEFSRKSNFVWN